jgi:DNA replication protein DnaC
VNTPQEGTPVAALLDFPAPVEPVDMDARAAEYAAQMRRNDLCAYFRANTPPSMQADFDATRPELQANAAQIAKILGWQYGTRGIVASGPTNRAKTRAMFALCRRLLCEESRSVGIWHAQDLFSEIQSCVRFGRDEAGDFIKRLAAKPVLFIDDYGQEALQSNKQEWAQGWFFRLLDLRMGAGLPLLLTTNLTAAEMADGARDISGHPLIRRLLELAEPVKFV